MTATVAILAPTIVAQAMLVQAILVTLAIAAATVEGYGLAGGTPWRGRTSMGWRAPVFFLAIDFVALPSRKAATMVTVFRAVVHRRMAAAIFATSRGVVWSAACAAGGLGAEAGGRT